MDQVIDQVILFVLAFLGGILTIVSPCILPVLPFVFSRADQPFRRSGLPLLVGMAITFSLAAAATTFAGSWIVRANQVGRDLAMLIFALLGIALLFPAVAEYLSRPFVRLDGRVHEKRDRPPSVARSLILGASTGLLWAPCAGPIPGLILTGAACPQRRTVFHATAELSCSSERKHRECFLDSARMAQTCRLEYPMTICMLSEKTSLSSCLRAGRSIEPPKKPPSS